MKAERRPIELSEEARKLLAEAAVPDAFVEQFRDFAATAVESPESPAEPMSRENGESFLAAPDHVQDASLAGAGMKPFYLTQTKLNLSFSQHVARGLWAFAWCPFPWLIWNTSRAGVEDAFLAYCMVDIPVSLRFFVIDDCEASKVKGKQNNKERGPLLMGAEYPAYAKAPHLGRLNDDALTMIQKSVDRANAIWAEWAKKHGVTTIKFAIPENPDDLGEKFAYALDLTAAPPTEKHDEEIRYKSEKYETEKIKILSRYPAIIIEEYNLCPGMYGTAKSRNITFENGKKIVIGTRSIKWGEVSEAQKDIYPPTPPPIEPVQAIEDAIAHYEKEGPPNYLDDWKNFKKKYKPGKIEKEWGVLELLGIAVDKRHGPRCINVFIFENFKDTGTKGDDGGKAETPGRNIILEEAAITDKTRRSLAHECGHNLNLLDEQDIDNLMHGTTGGGTKLEKKQCEDAAKQADDPQYRYP